MACCIVNQYIYIYMQYSTVTVLLYVLRQPSPQSLHHTKYMQEGRGMHATHLFFAFSLALSLSLSLMIGAWDLTSIFLPDSLCAILSLSSRISVVICLACSQQKSCIQENYNIICFFSLPTAESQSLSEPSLLLIHLFSIFRVGGKQAALTLSKSVSFSDRSLCTKGWQSCWQ